MKQVLLAMAGFLLLSLFSPDASAQDAGITLRMDGAPLEKVIDRVEQQSGYSFIYAKGIVDEQRKIDIDVRNASIETVLDRMFAGTDVAFAIDRRQIVLSKKEAADPVPAKQEDSARKISGRVTDAGTSEPLAGVAVYVSGSSAGVVSGQDGRWSISASDGDVLVFNCMGYVTRTLTVVRGTDVIDVSLQEDRLALEETVIVGFAVQKKVNLTGSVATVNAKAIESVPVSNVVQALQGQVPGLTITQTNGQLDTRPSINIRGLTTIGQGSNGDVLVLIDGVEGDLNTINPQDIDNISVLKDAAASSIYGSRAPFGVILVTTKKGSEGRAVINYNNSFRFNTAVNMPEEMDSYTWALYFNEASNNAGWGDVVGAEQMQRIRDYMAGKISYNTVPDGNKWSSGYELANDNLDYYKVFYKDVTFSQEHNLSVSGGTSKVNWYVSANYLKDNGKMNYGKDGLDRYNLFGKFEAQVTPWMRLSFNSRFVRKNYYRPSRMNDDWFREIGRQSWPVSPLYDPNGILYNDHALGLRDGGESRFETSVSTSQASVVLTPLKGWRIVAEGNYRMTQDYGHQDWRTFAQTAVDGVSTGNRWYANNVTETSVKNDYYNVNAYTDYELAFGSGHYFKVLAGVQAEESRYRNIYARQYGVVVPSISAIDAASGLAEDGSKVAPEVGGGYSSWSTMGVFARLNYNWKERYLLEANLRSDGSSRFRKNSRWGMFPSVSLGWNIAKEDFFSPASPYVSTLKIRASYGSLGNQNTSALYPTYQVMGYAFATGKWLVNGEKPNISWAPGLISQSLTWEKIRSTDIGIDVASFNDRLTLSFDWFMRDTDGMVGPADELPNILGTNVPVTNNTNLRTKGFDFEIMWKDRLRCGLGYSAKFILSDAQGTITKYSNPSGSLNNYYEGMKWGEFWGYETVGIAKTDEEMYNHLASMPEGGQDNLGSDWKAGDIMYRDLNGDGKIDSGEYTLQNHGDLKVLGNTTPRYNFAFDFNFEWKGIDLRIFLQGVGKRQYIQTSRYFFGATSDRWQSMGLTAHMDYFRNDPDHPLGLNLDAYYPRPVWGTDKNRHNQSRWVQDASYMRLKNLQLGYSFPAKLLKPIGLAGLRIYFSGENLLTFTKMTKIFDPETISGVDLGNVYPLSRTYSFGVSITL